MSTAAVFRHLRIPRLAHAKSAGLLAGCVSLVVALLVTAVTAAVGLGGLAGLGGLLGGNRLDYARGPVGEFFPLSDGFVQNELGPAFRQTFPPALPVTPIPLGPARSPTTSPAVPAAGSGGSVPLPDDTSADLRNDDFASAYAVRGLPFSSKTSERSGRQPDEPTSCASLGGTRWFRYTPRSDVDLTASTSGSSLRTAVAVFTGSTLRTLTQVVCASDARGDGVANFPAAGGTNYWFQVTEGVAETVAFTLDVRGHTSLASASSEGRPATADSDQPRMSANGRYIVFDSSADLVPGSQNGCVSTHHPEFFFISPPGPCTNIYRRDLLTGTTELVSTDDGEVGGDDDSYEGTVSADGRYVAFISWASNLVDDDTNNAADTFLRDMALGQTTRISVTSSSKQTTDPTRPGRTVVSGNGRFVAFLSAAPELVGECTARACRTLTFIRDVQKGQTHLVSVDANGDTYPSGSFVAGLSFNGSRVAFTARSGSQDEVVVSDWRIPGRSEVVSVAHDGEQANSGVSSRQFTQPALSHDGRYVTFVSDASNLVEDDTNRAADVFVRDLLLRRTVRISVATDGSQSHPPRTESDTLFATPFDTAAMSPDGRYVTFSSEAPDLVPGDTNGTFDVFLHDLLRRTTTRVSVLDDGRQSNGQAYHGTVSDGGSRVTFLTRGFRPEDDSGLRTVYVRQQTPS